MNVKIAPKLQAFVNEKVENGRFGSPSEMVNEALQLMLEREQARFLRLKELIGERIEEADRGELIDIDDELVNDIHRRGLERLAKLKKG